MRSKSLLVANREYVENLRTKMFWVGILFFPIILVLSIVVPRWLEGRKDVRRYAVLDRSGFLLERIEERSAMPDLEKVFREAVLRQIKGKESLAVFPASVQAVAAAIGQSLCEQAEGGTNDAALALMNQEDFRKGMRDFASLISGEPGSRMQQLLSNPLFKQAAAELEKFRAEIQQWWRSLPPKEAKEFGSDLSKSRYQRIDDGASGEITEETLNLKVADNDLFAYIVIPEDPIKGEQQFKYVSRNLTDEDLREWFARYANDELRERRLEQESIDRTTADWIQKPVDFEKKQVSKQGKEEEIAKEDIALKWAPVVCVYLLWIAVFSISQMLLTNTVEEKSNRILEVLLSSVSPLQLMSGKIIGIAWTGLTMVCSWVLSFVALVKFMPALMGKDLGVNLLQAASDPLLLTSFIVYFLLGYLFFAAFLVGIGSVCNTVKEAGNLMMPVSVLLMLPLFSMIPVGQDPNGTLAKFLSYIPPFTPFVMMNRAGGPPSLTEYVVTSILLIVTIVLVFWAAAKVFRIGILMTGKPPTPLEILRWIRAPIGQVPARKQE
ncbi:MAG: ABC transporter permease [Planctomycetes bacterium]|nr:ABC transporter permease [Planctomycetota bacterium]